MPTKPLDRLMFAQGRLCFFCKQPLPKAEASVEHLLAGANGGSDRDENCVACCKSVNALLGSMSLKEKFQVVLNQKGQFKCPNGTGVAIPHKPAVKKEISGSELSATSKFDTIVANLKNRKNAKPRTLKALTSTIRSLFKPELADAEVATLVQQLQSSQTISLSGDKVSYTF
jgi:hypothetical protein